MTKMTKNIISYFLVSTFFTFLSCNSKNTDVRDNKQIKLNQIRHVVNKTGLIDLPLHFDANIENSLNNKYDVNRNGVDTLIFDNDIYTIVGVLPDTTHYFAFLFQTIGDMLYPSIITIDKHGDKIDKQIICTGGCSGHAALEVKTCYDSVWIKKDLKVLSTSMVLGVVETEDSIPNTLNVCNKVNLEGYLDTNGQIKLKKSGLINCDNL